MMMQAIINLFNNKSALYQVFCFIVIGTIAAITHLAVVIILVALCSFEPLLANIVAFLIAFNVSYFGHRHWTFNTIEHQYKQTVWRFFCVALFSFALNEGLYYIFLIPLHIYYIVALIIVLMLVPPLTFALSKWWAFAKR